MSLIRTSLAVGAIGLGLALSVSITLAGPSRHIPGYGNPFWIGGNQTVPPVFPGLPRLADGPPFCRNIFDEQVFHCVQDGLAQELCEHEAHPAFQACQEGHTDPSLNH